MKPPESPVAMRPIQRPGPVAAGRYGGARLDRSPGLATIPGRGHSPAAACPAAARGRAVPTEEVREEKSAMRGARAVMDESGFGPVHPPFSIAARIHPA